VPHTECNQVQLSFHPDFDVEVRADAPTTSSDGGLLLLRQADERLGLSQWFADCLNDDRDAKATRTVCRHSRRCRALRTR